MKDLSVFAQAALSALARGNKKNFFLTSFSHIFHWLRGHTWEKKGKTPALLSGAISMKRRSAFIFPVLPPVLFTERRQQQWASWLNASHLSSPPHTLLAWERSAVWNWPGGRWSVLAYGQVVLFFIRVTFRITSDERNPQGSCSQRGYHMLWIRAL